MTEKKLLKKEKKNKNGKASVQKDTCATKTNLTDLGPGEESCVQVDAKAEKKRRKKEQCLAEGIFNDTNDEDICNTKKKKKKQVSDDKMEDSLSKIKEHSNKKKKKKATCADLEHAEREDEEIPKKTKKKRTSETEDQVKDKKNSKNDKVIGESIDEIPKKHKKSKIHPEHQETAEETEDIQQVKKSKMAPESSKKVKKREHGNKVTLAATEDAKKKEKSADGDINVEEEKTKKKKARKTSVECADVEETQPRKKKKSKKHSVDQDEAEPPLVNNEEGQGEESPITGTGRKNRKRKKCLTTVEAPVEDQCSENGTKRKKKKKVKQEVEDLSEPSQVDVVLLSVKKGNTDEATINQERSQELKMEMDQASRSQKAANPSGLGQWSTAQFDSSEKQQKFLRLMGGFKKGFQPAAGNAARANMALGKDGQQQLQQKLLDEFDRAQSRRLDFSNRGAGIGFSAPTNKKFSIDINASRSVRFDDWP